MADKNYKLTVTKTDGTTEEIEFTVPQGNKGETGDKGETGNKGKTGADGMCIFTGTVKMTGTSNKYPLPTAVNHPDNYTPKTGDLYIDANGGLGRFVYDGIKPQAQTYEVEIIGTAGYVRGATGDKGAKGDTGDKGLKGETGDKGGKGATGDTGANGKTISSITVMEV